MSAGGKNASAAAQGGTDGRDHSHRQRVEPRYASMAFYSNQRAQVFSYSPYFYAVAVVLVALQFQAEGLKAASHTFLPPFWLCLVGLLLSAVTNLTALRRSPDFIGMIASGVTTVFLLYLAVLYIYRGYLSPAFPDASVSSVWYLVGGILCSLLVGLNSWGIFAGHIIIKLKKIR